MTQAVQLGFVEPRSNAPLFLDPDWKNWDGGTIGAKPIWLNPRDIPLSFDLECTNCKRHMCFLLEIYCPLDQPVEAFHRALYVFCCANSTCVSEYNSYKCLRSQLPKVNEFYSCTGGTGARFSDWGPGPHVTLCELCGCRSVHKCGKCKRAHYCNREHQKLHWKYHKTLCDPSVTPSGPEKGPSLADGVPGHIFPGLCIEVEAEELEAEEVPLEADRETEAAEEEEEKEVGEALSSAAANLPGEDLVYDSFLARVRRGGSDQVLRYCRWPEDGDENENETKRTRDEEEEEENTRQCIGALKVSSASSSPSVPPCEHCGAARKFEFQVMPQLLHYLRVNDHTKLSEIQTNKRVENLSADESLDWGSLDIFTCTSSCTAGTSSYCTEYVWRQPPPHQ